MIWTCELIGLVCLGAAIFGLLSKATYQLKMATFLIGSGIICLLAIPFMVLRPKDYRNALYPAKACVILGKIIGLNVQVRGVENINKSLGGVVLLNHQSVLDILILAYLWPIVGRATVVSKKEILYIPFFGIGSYLWGTLFIDRSKRNDSVESLNKESKAINEHNCKLLFFPEGTRNSNNELLPFKKGPFYIAIKNQCPIQLVVISRYHLLYAATKNSRTFGRENIIVNILPQIPSKGYSRENIQILIDICRSRMQKEFLKLNGESKMLKI